MFRLQKFESDSEEEEVAAVASPMVEVKEELSESITPNDIEMFSAEDVGNNVTICHDADIDIKMDGDFVEAAQAASSTNVA